MSKGGYQILDLKGNNFTVGEAVTIDGIYEKIEGNYHKALLLENFSLSEIEQNATWVVAATGDSNYTLTGLSGHTVTVTQENEITIEEVAS